ncbi:hypothetical protein DMENIID0001_022590 [Sergentomyia squamirostris]
MCFVNGLENEMKEHLSEESYNEAVRLNRLLVDVKKPLDFVTQQGENYRKDVVMCVNSEYVYPMNGWFALDDVSLSTFRTTCDFPPQSGMSAPCDTARINSASAHSTVESLHTLSRHRKRFWTKNCVSYHKGFSLIGSYKKMFSQRVNISFIFSEIHNDKLIKDDPITGFFLLNRPCLLIREVELIKKIFVRDFSSFSHRGFTIDPKCDPIVGNFLPLTSGVKCREFRGLYTKAFAFNKMHNHFDRIEKELRGFEENLLRDLQPGQSNEYNIKLLSYEYCFKTVASAVFGISSSDIVEEVFKTYKDITSSIDDFSLWQFAKFYLVISVPRLCRLFKIEVLETKIKTILHTLFTTVLKERKRSGRQFDDFLDILQRKGASNSEIFTEDTLITQAGIICVLGTEAPSNVITFALYEMAKNPAIQDKLRTAIIDAFPKGISPTLRSIADVEYLDMVFKETLRFYPSVMFLDRVFDPDDELKTYSLEPYHSFKIPRGTLVFVSIYAYNRDPNIFANPHEFDPENFSPNNINTIEPNFFMAFGLGPRYCPGRKFAELQAKMALISILQNFKVEECDKTPKELVLLNKKPGFLERADPIILRFKRI